MRWKGALLLIIVVLALAGGWIFIASARSKGAQSVFILPDGTRAQIERVTFGTNHTFTKGWAMLAGVRRFVPRPLQRWFGAPTSSITTREETAILWYNRYNPATGTYPAPTLDTFRVIDEHGCVFHINQYGGNVTSPGFSVSSAYVPVFPRRQNSFKVTANASPSTKIGWTVENPFVTNPPSWKPETVPATRAFEGVEFTLERIRGHFYDSGNWFETKFRITSNGVDRTDWYKPRVTFVDATGNRTSDRLCPYEPAWKLEVDFYKSHKASFPEEALWRVANVNVPGSGEVVALNQQTNIGGVSLKLIALCGSGDFTFTNGICAVSNAWAPEWRGESSSSSYVGGPNGKVEISFRHKEPSLLLEIDRIDESDKLLIRFRDDQDRTFAADFKGSANKTYRYNVKAPKEMKETSGSLAIEFIPQKPVHLDYIAEPPRPK
jgi:hypothetical protein